MITLDAAVQGLQLFGEPTRLRLAALLSRHELAVADLTAVTGLPQSRISTHLGRLREAGVLRDRREGTSTFYSLNDGAMPEEARRLWALVQAQVQDGVLEGDRERLEALLRAREGARRWPDRLAGQMERHYSPGRTWESLARGLMGLLDLGDVLDAGSGDGSIAGLLAPRARSVTCLDRNLRMIEAARLRSGRTQRLRCVRADLHDLPFPPGTFDAVLLFNVLTHVERPARALRETARVLRRGGRIALVTLKEHRRPEVTSSYGDVHPGFAPGALRRLLVRAGLSVESCAVTSRERREPHFEVVTAFARKGGRR